MNAATITNTYTQTDISNVWEQYCADLMMLAIRTQAMGTKEAETISQDIWQMLRAECISEIHIQLVDHRNACVRAHVFRVERNVSWNNQRPGDNRWPCLPNSQLQIVVVYSDVLKWNKLLSSGLLKSSWTSTNYDTRYLSMKQTSGRKYASNNYGMRRDSYIV